jgi:hypothetical protein
MSFNRHNAPYPPWMPWILAGVFVIGGVAYFVAG